MTSLAAEEFKGIDLGDQRLMMEINRFTIS